MKINIAKDLDFPTDAVTQTFSHIGRKGAGKTYLASMIAEQMLNVKAQVIVIDPIGNWWGLRVNSDGKKKGKDIFVIGGTHGDVPISHEAGKEIAKILTEKNISVVLDISEFRKNQRKKFVTDFAEEFYHLKKSKPSAVHIFLEESQKFVPQRVQKDETRMLGAWEDIVRLGRNYGIGCSLISQRPQSINKEVLSQVECLCVLQVTGLHERKALEGWVQEAGEDRKIVGELPSFKTGEGYVWSPSWLRIFKKVKFNKKTTLDTSATPELGKATKIAKISKIDIKKLREQMSEVINEEREELKKISDYKTKVVELKREIRILETSKPKPEVDERQLGKVFEDGKILGRKEVEKEKEQELSNFRKYRTQIFKSIKLINTTCGKLLDIEEDAIKKIHINSKPQINNPLPIRERITTLPPKPIRLKPAEGGIIHDGETKLRTGAIRILNFVAMFESLTKEKAKTLCGISSKGTFGNYITDLARSGFVTVERNIVRITNEGMDYIGEVEPMPTDTESLINLWSKHLRTGAINMLRICVEIYPSSITKDDLQEQVGILSRGTFGNYIADLRRNGLIKVSGQDVTASKELLEI